MAASLSRSVADHAVPRGTGGIFARTRPKLAACSHIVQTPHNGRAAHCGNSKGRMGCRKLEKTSRHSKSLILYASSDGLLLR
jgi:hypothetical protein